jgi:hypothetical protein
MAEIYAFNDRVESLFQLLGTKENDMSYSVGYALGNADGFLHNFLKRISIDIPFESGKIKIRLQTHEKEKGFTDFEIVQEGEFHIIIEAKRGWNFPTRTQLEKYVGRDSFKSSPAKDKRIIVLNESIPAFTYTHFDIREIDGVAVEVITWKEIQHLAANSKAIRREAENRMLWELNNYLEKTSTMQKVDSNWVYVVSLGNGIWDGWSISWQDIVEKYSRYFHPVGGSKGGWPVEPPNYIAFRYQGKLQSIHHIDRYELFEDPSQHFQEIPSEKWHPHYLYHLGPAIKPAHEVRSGEKIIRSMRVWAMLDLLLTSQTIQEARDKSIDRAHHI